MGIYDTDKEAHLKIDELHVLLGKGDMFNYYTENKASYMPQGNHGCQNELYNSNGYARLRHYYDIPYKLKYIINLYYRAKRFTCQKCKHKLYHYELAKLLRRQ